MEFETVVCPLHEGHQRAGKRLSDLSIVLPNRAAKNHFVWTWYSECLVKDHVVRLFRREGLTGFEVKPVHSRFRELQAGQPPELWELVVVGWAGLAPAQSGIKVIEHCNACGHTRYSGLKDPEALIDASQWDGSDFFMVWPLPRYIFITDHVAQVIRAHSLSGAVIMDVKDIRPTDGHSPGRLSNVMPQDYARKFGEPLGIY
jgi:hypothetical protein